METQNLKFHYDRAIELDHQTYYEMDSWDDSQTKLDHLKECFNNQNLIGKISIYKNGEILALMKKVCQTAKKKFKAYVEEELGISESTAENKIGVFIIFKDCPTLIEKIPDTILYQICAKNFNTKLRDYMVKNGMLDNISGAEFKNNIEAFGNGGFKAIEKIVEKTNRDNRIIHQCEYTLSIIVKAIRELEDLKKKINIRGNSGNNGITELPEQSKSEQPESVKINFKLYDACEEAIFFNEQSINFLYDALKEAKRILNESNITVTDEA